jgi:hypothetical protein
MLGEKMTTKESIVDFLRVCWWEYDRENNEASGYNQGRSKKKKLEGQVRGISLQYVTFIKYLQERGISLQGRGPCQPPLPPLLGIIPLSIGNNEIIVAAYVIILNYWL